MSLRGYKKKSKPALWTTVPGAKPVATQQRAKPAPKARARIRPVSKRKAKEKTLYREEARQFVAAAVRAGGRCPVVATVPELRNGVKYGHPISDRLNEVHHTRGRAGSLLRDQRFWMAVSKQGHRWIHENVEAAQRLGFVCQPGEWNNPPKEAA